MADKTISNELKHSDHTPPLSPRVRGESGGIIGTARPFATEAAAMIGMSNPITVLGAAPWPDEPWWRRLSPSTLFVLLSAALAVFFLLHELVISKILGFPTGESWVRMVYARNFFHHLEFEYTLNTPGARPTSPFWIVVLSLAVNLFRDPILAAKLLGSVFLFLTGYYIFRLLRTVKLDYASALIGGVLVITSAALAWSELSGLESTLSTALVVGGLWWHFGPPDKITRSFQVFITGAIFALGALTRPEIGSVFIVLVIWQAVSSEHRPLEHVVLMLAGFILILGPVAITNIAVGGSLVPATFSGALGSDSIIRMIWHGELDRIIPRLFLSFSGVWAITREVYWAENPIWFFTIIAALGSRHRNNLIPRDAADRLFSLSVLILFLFPYVRSLSLGVDDVFGNDARLVHFILPIYGMAGILSFRVLARSELFRGISPKQMLLLLASGIGIFGILYILLFQSQTASAINPTIEIALLLFFEAVLLVAAFRGAGLSFRKSNIPHFVTEQERNETKLLLHDDEEDPHLSAPALATLHAMLLIALAWNSAMLPRAANDFGSEVKEVNRYRPLAAPGISVLGERHSQQVGGFERANFAESGNMAQDIDANSGQAKF